MKRLTALILALIMTVCLCSCASSGGRLNETLSGDFTDAGGIEYSVRYPETGYSLSSSENSDRLTFSDGSSYLEFRYYPGEYPDALLPSYAESLIDCDSVEFCDITAVGSTDESGEMIKASGENAELSAWLIECANGTFSVVKLVRNGEKCSKTFDKILDTLEIIYF